MEDSDLDADMKVIEGPKEWTSTVKCYACTATLEIGMDDVMIGIFGGCAWESGDEYVYVCCCVCGTDLKLKQTYEMPKLVVIRARENSKK